MPDEELDWLLLFWPVGVSIDETDIRGTGAGRISSVLGVASDNGSDGWIGGCGCATAVPTNGGLGAEPGSLLADWASARACASAFVGLPRFFLGG